MANQFKRFKIAKTVWLTPETIRQARLDYDGEYVSVFLVRRRRQPNICLTGIAYIGAKLAERSEKQVL